MPTGAHQFFEFHFSAPPRCPGPPAQRGARHRRALSGSGARTRTSTVPAPLPETRPEHRSRIVFYRCLSVCIGGWFRLFL